jgi:hypothetical protein
MGGLGLNEVRELRQLREENRKLKGIVADLTLDKHILQEVSQKVLKPAKQRELVREIREAFQLNELRACGLMRITRWSDTGNPLRPKVITSQPGATHRSKPTMIRHPACVCQGSHIAALNSAMFGCF